MATLASAALLVQAGRLADTLPLRWLAAGLFVLFAVVCVGMAQVSSVAMLVIVVFGLRFCGQGMLSHVSMTAMGRWFVGNRGRAVAFAGLGYPLGEALLPAVVVRLSDAIGWRESWLVVAGLLLLVFLPLAVLLLRRERRPQSLATGGGEATGLDGRHWTRGEMLRHGLFWTLLPGLLAPPFISTSVFFHQVHIVAIKGWDMVAFADAYPVFAVTGIASALAAGVIVDRFGARRLLPFYLLPLAAALTVLFALSAPWTVVPYMGLMGVTGGLATTLLGALWAELYGTRHLGSIRAVAVAGMVLSTGLGPGITGFGLDQGLGIETQALLLAGYLVAVSVFFAGLVRRF